MSIMGNGNSAVGELTALIALRILYLHPEVKPTIKLKLALQILELKSRKAISNPMHAVTLVTFCLPLLQLWGIFLLTDGFLPFAGYES